MPRALKVYRTPIGFHDAYVAAPSQKAALEAWGSARNLFAQGSAELVTDADLTAAPLAAPGTVIRRLRGSADEQIAALPADAPPAPPAAAKPRGDAAAVTKPAAAARPKPAPKPKPSRAALDRAEEALEAAACDHDAARRALEERAAALERERRDLADAQARDTARLEAARDKAEASHRAALQRWRAG